MLTTPCHYGLSVSSTGTTDILLRASALGLFNATALHFTTIQVISLPLCGHEGKHRVTSGLSDSIRSSTIKHHAIEGTFNTYTHSHKALHGGV